MRHTDKPLAVTKIDYKSAPPEDNLRMFDTFSAHSRTYANEHEKHTGRPRGPTFRELLPRLPPTRWVPRVAHGRQNLCSCRFYAAAHLCTIADVVDTCDLLLLVLHDVAVSVAV